MIFPIYKNFPAGKSKVALKIITLMTICLIDLLWFVRDNPKTFSSN